MPQASLSRNGSSVTFDLLGSGNELAVSRDVGKPNATFQSVGRPDPRSQDHLSAGDNWTVAGILLGSNAYSDAKSLAEDVIKPRPSSTNVLTLDLSNLPSHSTYEVAAPTAGALELTYLPGRRNMVGVQLRLVGVSATAGGSQTTATTASTESGSGVTIRRDSNTAITITDNLQVVRSVGHPDLTLTPRPNALPKASSSNVPAEDTFEISGRLTSDNAESDAQILEEDIVRAPLGNDSLTLSFNDSLFGLDAYDVLPNGSQALRTTFSVGETGRIRVPTLDLRVVSGT